ncbi:hypothetical protein [Streptomyces sp. TP-A0356]|uniref:hypothetical protein n=1 Tax=Streptomyces sp. TP-A0356 TaxID=1359208 RepID=UPI0018FE2701|nr:hypothetical protein [Streptomyces sp. TP-A0356]
MLHGEQADTREQAATLIRALDGEPGFFRPHREESRPHQTVPSPPPRLPDIPAHRLNRLLTTFGEAFQDTRTLAPSPELVSRRRALRRQPAQAAWSSDQLSSGT